MLLRYALRRIALSIPLLLGISVLTFGILHLAPGNPVESQIGMNPRYTPETIRALRAMYDLDKPLPIQYAKWLGKLLRFDLGFSLRDQRKVSDKLLEALPPTLILNALSLILVFAIGVPLGIFSAARAGSGADRLLSGFSFLAWSLPGFWLALMLQILLGVKLGALPVAGYISLDSWSSTWAERAADLARHLVLPLAVTTFGAWATVSRYMRNSMMEVLSQDYIRTARAKGCAEREVLLRHALPNALLPMITLLGLSLPGLIGGSVIIETVFSWPGMGRLAWEAATGYDYPVIMGLAFFASLLTVVGNLVADLACAVADPRIRYQ